MTNLAHLLADLPGCELRVDPLTRRLYATDASLYQVEPAGVAFPRNAHEAAAIMRAAADAGIAITPRGAGSGLVGGAIGDGLVIDFARHNQQIWDFNRDQRTVRAGAGVVLDQLNAALRPHGLCFGPDVATSSRATIGGMIANNSSGARTPLYGTTADHVRAVECVTADGRVVTFAEPGVIAREIASAGRIVHEHAREIAERMPAGLLKRWPGYALDRCLRQPALANILAGSEGTLAGIVSAELSLVPLPREKGLGLLFFASVADAMQATVELLDLQPAAIEHIDNVLTDQTKGSRQFQAARDLLDLDRHPCKSILMIEFYDDVAGKLAALEQRRLGVRRRMLSSAAEMNLVWALRKAGVALLTGRKGRAKPVTCIEDAAVLPRRLPEYVAALRGILDPLGVEACFYGHAASGLLHVRPVLDLHTADGLAKFRHIAEEVSAAVRQFKGSLAAEHGVGIARTEFMRQHLGDALLGAMRAIKSVFDPRNILNPGKIFDDGRYRIDGLLRAERQVEVPFEPVLAFAAKDESFLANLEQCNGCGGCRKSAPTMCPTFLATGDEALSTRGRANIIRAALEGGFGDPLLSRELEEVLGSCLSCKACTTECPSNVNLALLKAELLHARHGRSGPGLAARLLSRVDWIGAAGSLAPGLANAALASPLIRRLLRRVAGLTDRRPLPSFAEARFDEWFHARRRAANGRHGRVLLWDDCFVRHYEPQIGRAAVRVLESAGYDVGLLHGRACCGRPAFSQGSLDDARRMGAANIAALNREAARDSFSAVIFLEPSCHSMFGEDYRELKLHGAGEWQPRSFLLEDFLAAHLQAHPGTLPFRADSAPVAIHAHCHAKALAGTSAMARLAKWLPGRPVTLLDTGCCGMAGAFGAMEDKYDLSMQVAAPLVEKIRAQPAGTVLVASGTSCRQQITHTTGLRPLHIAELLAASLEPLPSRL